MVTVRYCGWPDTDENKVTLPRDSLHLSEPFFRTGKNTSLFLKKKTTQEYFVGHVNGKTGAEETAHRRSFVDRIPPEKGRSIVLAAMTRPHTLAV